MSAREALGSAGGNNHARHRGKPIEYKVISKQRLVMTNFGPRVTANDIADLARSLRAHPSFAPSFSEILDMTAVEQMDLRGEDMMRLADQVDPFSSQSKRAFVVKNAFQAHEVRMYQILRSSKDKIRTFGSLEEAERWIFDIEQPTQ